MYSSDYRPGTISQRQKTTNVIDTKICQLRPSMYGLNLKAFLSACGDYENYETHTPMYIEKPQIMLEAIKLGKQYDCPALKRTIYMYLLQKKGFELKNDVKFGEPYREMQYPFFSLTDTEFKAFEKELNKIVNN